MWMRWLLLDKVVGVVPSCSYDPWVHRHRFGSLLLPFTPSSWIGVDLGHPEVDCARGGGGRPNGRLSRCHGPGYDWEVV